MHDERLQILHHKEIHALNEIVDTIGNNLRIKLEAKDGLHEALSCAILHSKEEHKDVSKPIELIPFVVSDKQHKCDDGLCNEKQDRYSRLTIVLDVCHDVAANNSADAKHN